MQSGFSRSQGVGSIHISKKRRLKNTFLGKLNNSYNVSLIKKNSESKVEQTRAKSWSKILEDMGMKKKQKQHKIYLDTPPPKLYLINRSKENKPLASKPNGLKPTQSLYFKPIQAKNCISV